MPAPSPHRVAIIGAGPAGFYAAEALLSADDRSVTVDLFDRLPTPFGLVRGGVAPDHPKIKNVTRVYDRTAQRETFRFFGNVSFGTDLTLDDLQTQYHQVLFATGAQTDRHLNIPGEDLDRVHSATEFVAWYNGHPDFRHYTFDLSHEHVIIVGVGNVALDVARMLCRTPDELGATDIADHALAALHTSAVRRVTLLGRRGPAQAAFTLPEAKELATLPGTSVHVPPREATLDSRSAELLEERGKRSTHRIVDLLTSWSATPHDGEARRQLTLRFLVSPTRFDADAEGGVGAVHLVRNELYETDDGRQRPRPTDETEKLEAGLVFRSIGYRGVPLPGVPFREDWGIIPNEEGRVLKEGAPQPGLYCSGWIKRGPSGVIGTNKADATETVAHMLDDADHGRLMQPAHPTWEAMPELLRSRSVDWFSYADWQRLDALEQEAGAAEGRPRVKMTSVDEMRRALGRIPEHA